jgi:hypothetical protein
VEPRPMERVWIVLILVALFFGPVLVDLLVR